MIIHFIASFLAGALFSNAIPHLTAGLRGEPFPTPFTAPRGIAPSPPELNVVWGSANLFVGVALMGHPSWPGLAAGFLLAGWFLAKNFGRVRANGFKPPVP